MVWAKADDDYASNRINITPEKLTFTSTTWSTPQLVQIQPFDDNIKFDATLYTLQHNLNSTEYGYKSIGTAENENIYCLVEDNDVPGIKNTGTNSWLQQGGRKEIKFNLTTFHKDPLARLVIKVDIDYTEKALITATPETIIITQDNWTNTHSVSLALDKTATDAGGYITLKVTEQSKNTIEYNNIKSEPIPLGIPAIGQTFKWQSIGKHAAAAEKDHIDKIQHIETTIPDGAARTAALEKEHTRYKTAAQEAQEKDLTDKTTTDNGPILSFANDSRLTVNWARPDGYTGLFNVMFDETPQQPNCTIGPTKNIDATTITVDTCLPLVHSTFVARVQLATHPEQKTDPSVEKWSTIAKETQKKEGLVTLGQHFSK